MNMRIVLQSTSCTLKRFAKPIKRLTLQYSQNTNRNGLTGICPWSSSLRLAAYSGQKPENAEICVKSSNKNN